MKQKTLKGMTLAEIIIAMAIFAMLGVILIKLGTIVDQTTKSSNRLNKRVAVQAPYAASKETTYYLLDSDGKPVLDVNDNPVTADLKPDISQVQVYIDLDGTDGNGDGIKDGNGTPDVVKVKKRDGTEVNYDSLTTLHGKHYSTKDIVVNKSEVYDSNDVSNTGHHLQFIEIVDRIELDFSLGHSDSAQIYLVDEADGRVLENAVWTYSDGGEDIATIDDTGKITTYDKDGTCIAVGIADNGIYCVTINVGP
jgi:prepilin-type N-terminal cleavage/methylation domain-containing protein